LTYIPVLYLPFYDMGGGRKDGNYGEDAPTLEMHELQVRERAGRERIDARSNF